MLNKSKQAFEMRMHTATKKGLFNFTDANYREQIEFDVPIPGFAQLQDIAFIVRKPPMLGEDPANTKIALGVWNGRGAFIGKENASGDVELGVANPEMP